MINELSIYCTEKEGMGAKEQTESGNGNSRLDREGLGTVIHRRQVKMTFLINVITEYRTLCRF